MLYAIIGGGLLFLMWFGFTLKSAGRNKALRQNAERTIRNVDTAKSARERLRSDPDYAGRVRSQFTRK